MREALCGNLYKIKSKVQRLSASSEDSGGVLIREYEIVSAVVKATERLLYKTTLCKNSEFAK